MGPAGDVSVSIPEVPMCLQFADGGVLLALEGLQPRAQAAQFRVGFLLAAMDRLSGAVFGLTPAASSR